jgi:hypothetical protein
MAADPKKVANNILEFLIDPTKIPVQQRVYFRPEEKLQNETYEGAKADAVKAYGDQKNNTDFYPGKNRSQRSSNMDRKAMVASFDILSKNFKNEEDPFAVQLRTMAYAMAKMGEEELVDRLAEEAPDFEQMDVEAKKKVEFVTCPKCGNPKVMKQTGYCLKCKTKGIGKGKKAPEEEKPAEKEASEVNDFWGKEASDLIAKTLVKDVIGEEMGDDDDDKPAAKEPVKEACPVKESKKEEKVDPMVDPEEKEACPKEAASKKDAEEPVMDPMPISAPEAKGVEISIKVQSAEEKNPVKPEEKKLPAEEVPEAVESKVDTDILKAAASSSVYDGIEMEAGLMTSDDIGEMSNEEKQRLSQLFAQ